MKREARQEIIEALAAQGIEALYGKGGFYLRGQGFVTFAQARKLAAVVVPESLKREQRESILYGDAAIVHLISGRI
jgi:hypothetical protein